MRRATAVYCLPQRSSRLSHTNSHRRALVFLMSFFFCVGSQCARGKHRVLVGVSDACVQKSIVLQGHGKGAALA